MAKRGSNVTVVTGKTLENLINLQMSTQDALTKITNSMQDAADKKSDDLQNQLLLIQQKLLDVNLDNFKLNRKQYDAQQKTFSDLSKGLKDWQSWGDKLKDLKGAMQDKLSPDSIQKKLLSKLNIGGILNQKLMALDFKKQAKALGTAPADKKELDKQANAFAAAQMAMMRENQKIENLKKKSGATDDQIKNSPIGSQLIANRDKQAGIVSNLMPGGKSAKDLGNKMGGNTGGLSVPLTPAEANPLTAPSGKENQLEQAQQQENQLEILTQIRDNTSIMAGKDQEGNKKQDSSTSTKGMLGGLLDSVMGLFGDSFFTAIRSIFSARALLRVITKFFAPAMIIGSLVNGIMDGFKVWQDTGSLSDALIAGLGGVLEFITFGLFDKDTIKNIVSAVSGFVDKYIMQPISNLVDGLGDAFDTYIAQPFKQAFDSLWQMFTDLGQMFTDYVVTPIQNAFQPISDFFSDMIDTVINFFKSIEIPGVSFKVPFKDDPVQFGPWHPFSDDPAAQTQAAAVTPTSGKVIADASKNNADQQAIVDGKANAPQQTSVNTAVQNNSNTTNVIKPSVRNQESSQSKYAAARY